MAADQHRLAQQPQRKKYSTSIVEGRGSGLGAELWLYCSDFDLTVLAYRVYAHSVSMKNSPLSTSLRSATHATDSTRNG